jgi:hypothetical protein
MRHCDARNAWAHTYSFTFTWGEKCAYPSSNLLTCVWQFMSFKTQWSIMIISLTFVTVRANISIVPWTIFKFLHNFWDPGTKWIALVYRRVTCVYMSVPYVSSTRLLIGLQWNLLPEERSHSTVRASLIHLITMSSIIFLLLSPSCIYADLQWVLSSEFT